MFFVLLELFCVILLVIAVVTQIIVPAVKGTKLFPLFDKRKKLKDKIVEQETRKEELSLQSKIENVKESEYD